LVLIYRDKRLEHVVISRISFKFYSCATLGVLIYSLKDKAGAHSHNLIYLQLLPQSKEQEHNIFLCCINTSCSIFFPPFFLPGILKTVRITNELIFYFLFVSFFFLYFLKYTTRLINCIWSLRCSFIVILFFPIYINFNF